jgi:hypothetical protein
MVEGRLSLVSKVQDQAQSSQPFDSQCFVATDRKRLTGKSANLSSQSFLFADYSGLGSLSAAARPTASLDGVFSLM